MKLQNLNILSVRVLFILIFVGLSSLMMAQTPDGKSQDDGKSFVTRAVIIDGDTVALMWLPTVSIYAPMKFNSKVQVITYTKLVNHIKKVYPYAKLIGQKVNEINKYLNTLKNERVREKEKDRLEKELTAEFEDELKKLTNTQGKILMKLIYRETSKTTYEIVKDYRGGFNAMLWQSVARIFGYNMKVTYDPNGTDRDIENIVIMLENGTLK